MKRPSKPKADRRSLPRAVPIAGGIVAALLAALCAFLYLYPPIFPGVTVGTIAVGGLSREQAAARIEAESAPLYRDAEVAVTIYDATYTIPVRDVLEGVDGARSAANAYAVGREGNPFARLWHVLRAAAGQGEAPIAATVDEAGLRRALEAIAAEALTEPVAPTWELGTDTMTIHAGKPGVHFDTAAVEQALTDKICAMDFEPYAVSTELTEAPAIDIDAIAAAVIGEAVSATVDKADGQTIIPDRAGVQFDVEQARRIIGDGSADSYTIPVTTTPAKVTADDLQEKLFRDTLARCSTDLNEGNVPRTNNVRLAAAAIDGCILEPGEHFSYNDVVGERTPARGYKAAGAYAGNEIIDEVGGGVCQPSSTLYMAVLRADLEVTQRVNHSFTVSYTPLGEDATVSWGGPDFCFRNDTDYPIKIAARQADGTLTMTIYGTKTSDKTVTTRTEVLETFSPQTIEKVDRSMKSGEKRVETTPITGYSTRTYKVITENGQTTEVLANSSRYNKRDKLVYVGPAAPKPVEPPAPDPAPAPVEGDAPDAPSDDPEQGAA
ncbi:MAG: VanW family protein [Eubacteriales bacterium]|nr:VanW family protein [Eubacteriales bacterium]